MSESFNVERAIDRLKKTLNEYDDSVILTNRFAKYLIKQAERVQELEIEYQVRQIEYLEEHIDRLEKENKRYRETLEFYADEDTYKEVRHEPAYMGGVPIEPPYGEPPLIYYDNYGEKARKALEGEE